MLGLRADGWVNVRSDGGRMGGWSDGERMGG